MPITNKKEKQEQTLWLVDICRKINSDHSYKTQGIRREAILDSITSETIGMGTPDDKLNYFQYTLRRISPSLAKIIVINADMIQNIVEIPAALCSGNGFNVKMKLNGETLDDSKIDNWIEERWKELKIKTKNQKLIETYNIFQDGVLVYPVIEEVIQSNLFSNNKYEEKLSMSNIKKLKGINIIDPEDFSINEMIQSPLSVDYKNTKNITISEAGRVHDTRYKWFVKRYYSRYNIGVSKLDKCLMTATALQVAIWGVASMMTELQTKILRLPTFAPTGRFAGSNLVSKIKNFMSSNKMMILGEGEEFIREGLNVTGISEMTNYLWEHLSYLTREPQAIIKGISLGQLTGSNVELHRYSQGLNKEYQETVLEPFLLYILKILAYEQDGYIYQTLRNKIEDVKFEIEFKPIFKTTPEEEEDLLNRKVQRGSAEINAGISTNIQKAEELYPHRADNPKQSFKNFDEDLGNIIGSIGQGKKGKDGGTPKPLPPIPTASNNKESLIK